MTEVDRLLADVEETLGDGPTPTRRQHQRETLLRNVRTAWSKPSSPRRMFWPLVTAAVAAAAILVALWFQPDRSLEVRIDGELQELTTLELVTTETTVEQRNFSDGSHLQLLAAGRARVERVNKHAARVELAEGEVQAFIQPESFARWTFFVGNFEIRVTGTLFRLLWREERGHVEVDEGEVTLFGPSLPATGRKVGAGGRWQLGEAPADPSSAETTQSAPTLKKGRRPAQKRREDDLASWQELAGRGQYTEAWKIASALDLPALERTLPARELDLLSDVARYAGEPDAAATLLQRLRSRFPRSTLARGAAFKLGRISADQLDDLDAAERWFAIYLTKESHGTFAQEARGRLMAIAYRRGRLADAKAAASEYLRWHPNGSYADQAKELLR